MALSMPLALGSYWGAFAHHPDLILLAIRIADEERMLVDELVDTRSIGSRSDIGSCRTSGKARSQSWSYGGAGSGDVGRLERLHSAAEHWITGPVHTLDPCRPAGRGWRTAG